MKKKVQANFRTKKRLNTGKKKYKLGLDAFIKGAQCQEKKY